MGKLRGQVSPDYAVSAFLFSLIVLFLFYYISSTYYSRTWELTKAEKTLEASKLAFFLIGDEGNWSSNPFKSTSLGLAGKNGINETKLRYFMGMPYPHLLNRTGLRGEFKIEVIRLPSIAVKSDVRELYIREPGMSNATVEISFQTSKEAKLYVVVTGGNVTMGGDWGTSLFAVTNSSRFHSVKFTLYPGVYNLKALAVTDNGNEYGAYESVFRVV